MRGSTSLVCIEQLAADEVRAAPGDNVLLLSDRQVPSVERGSEMVIRRAGGREGERITDRAERRATVLVETDELTISEFDYGPGERGAKLHVHREHADGLLVLEGEFTFHFRNGSRALPAGTPCMAMTWDELVADEWLRLVERAV